MTLGNKIVKRMKVLSLWACSTRHATYINFSLLQTGTSTCDECVYATLKIFRSSGRSSFHFCQLEIEPSGSAVTPNSTVGASYMVSKYQLKGIVGRKTMFCTDWTILCRRLLLREKKMMFCSIKASGAWCARNHLFYFVSCFHSHHRVVSSCTTPPPPWLPHAFRIPQAALPVQRIPPCPLKSKKQSVVWMDILWNFPLFIIGYLLHNLIRTCLASHPRWHNA